MANNILSIERVYHIAKAGLIVLSTTVLLLVILYEANTIHTQNQLTQKDIVCISELFSKPNRANLVIADAPTCKIEVAK